jgi:hypothetical protein
LFVEVIRAGVTIDNGLHEPRWVAYVRAVGPKLRKGIRKDGPRTESRTGQIAFHGRGEIGGTDARSDVRST